MERLVLVYELVDAANRKPWRGVNECTINLSCTIKYVVQLRQAIYAAHPNMLAHVGEAQLRLVSRGHELKPRMLLSECDLDDTVKVIVPSAPTALVRRQRYVLEFQADVPNKKARLGNRSLISAVAIQAAADLSIESWTSIGPASLKLDQIEPDFPKCLYIRQATLDIIRFYLLRRDTELATVLMGSPGVGKSALLMLFAFQRALCEKKRVVLFRALRQGYSLLHLDVENKDCWRIDQARVEDLAELRGEDFELFVDGFDRDTLKQNRGVVCNFRFLATSSAEFELKSGEDKVRLCLVPFWSKSDLFAIGKSCLHKTDAEIEEQYFYSGGNLRFFLSDKPDVETLIRAAVHQIECDCSGELLYDGWSSVPHIDHLRMNGIVKVDPGKLAIPVDDDLDKYEDCGWWAYAVTSSFALRLLSEKLPLNFYKQLWVRGHQLSDESVKTIAFENYMLAVAREGKSVELEMWSYDQGGQGREYIFH